MAVDLKAWVTEQEQGEVPPVEPKPVDLKAWVTEQETVPKTIQATPATVSKPVDLRAWVTEQTNVPETPTPTPEADALRARNLGSAFAELRATQQPLQESIPATMIQQKAIPIAKDILGQQGPIEKLAEKAIKVVHPFHKKLYEFVGAPGYEKPVEEAVKHAAKIASWIHPELMLPTQFSTLQTIYQKHGEPGWKQILMGLPKDTKEAERIGKLSWPDIVREVNPELKDPSSPESQSLVRQFITEVQGRLTGEALDPMTWLQAYAIGKAVPAVFKDLPLKWKLALTRPLGFEANTKLAKAYDKAFLSSVENAKQTIFQAHIEKGVSPEVALTNAERVMNVIVARSEQLKPPSQGFWRRGLGPPSVSVGFSPGEIELAGRRVAQQIAQGNWTPDMPMPGTVPASVSPIEPTMPPPAPSQVPVSAGQVMPTTPISPVQVAPTPPTLPSEALTVGGGAIIPPPKAVAGAQPSKLPATAPEAGVPAGKAPELMTPNEWQTSTYPYKAAEDMYGTHRPLVQDAANNHMPVSSFAVDAYGIKLPPGYVREGDRYVFKPTQPPSPAPAAEPPSVPAGVGKVPEVTATRPRRGGGPIYETFEDPVLAKIKEHGGIRPYKNPTKSQKEQYASVPIAFRAHKGGGLALDVMTTAAMGQDASVDDLLSTMKGSRRYEAEPGRDYWEGEAQRARDEAAKAFSLESTTPEQLKAEQTRREQQATIEQRQATPLVGRPVETTGALPGIGEENLFNRPPPVSRAELEAKPYQDLYKQAGEAGLVEKGRDIKKRELVDLLSTSPKPIVRPPLASLSDAQLTNEAIQRELIDLHQRPSRHEMEAMLTVPANKPIPIPPETAENTPLDKAAMQLVPTFVQQATTRLRTPEARRATRIITYMDIFRQRLEGWLKHGTQSDSLESLGLKKMTLEQRLALADRQEAGSGELDGINQTIRRTLIDAGVPVRFLERYYPRFVLKEGVKEKLAKEMADATVEIAVKNQSDQAVADAIKNRPILSDIVANLIKTGEATGYYDAVDKLQNHMSREFNQIGQEFHRGKEIIPSQYWERDPSKVYPELIEAVARRAAGAQYFGKDGERIPDVLKDVKYNPDTELYGKYLDAWSGKMARETGIVPTSWWGKQWSKVWRKEYPQWTSFVKIGAGWAAAKNFFQPAISSVWKEGFFNTFEGGIKVITESEYRRFVRESGTTGWGNYEAFGFERPTGKAGKVQEAMPGTYLFKKGDIGNLYIAGPAVDMNVQKQYAIANDPNARAWRRKYARDYLGDKNVDPSKPLTKDARMNAMVRGSQESQLRKDVLKDPLARNDPKWRPAFLYKLFGWKQTMLVKDTLKREWQRGNYIPFFQMLGRLIVSGAVAGEVGIDLTNRAKSLLSGHPVRRKEEWSDWQRYVNDIGWVSSLGAVSDMMALNDDIEKYGLPATVGRNAVRAGTPVALSDLVKIIESYNAITRDVHKYGWPPALRSQASQIMGEMGGLGYAVSERLMTKGQATWKQRNEKAFTRQQVLKARLSGNPSDWHKAARRMNMYNEDNPDNPIVDADYDHKALLKYLEDRRKGLEMTEFGEAVSPAPKPVKKSPFAPRPPVLKQPRPRP